MVEVYDGDKKLGETKADQAGNYRFSLPTLSPGQHTLSTRTNDAKGNPIASSAPIPVTVSGGQVAQAAPTAVGAKPGAQAPTFTDLPQGTQWPSGMPAMLAGVAPPGSKVQVFANDKLSGETVAGQDGKWSLPQPPLPTGDHFLTTRAYGPNGALLGESSPAKVTVVGPGTPTVAVKPPAGQATAAAGVAVTRTAVVTSAAGMAPKATLTASLATTATRVTTATLNQPPGGITGTAVITGTGRPTGVITGTPQVVSTGRRHHRHRCHHWNWTAHRCDNRNAAGSSTDRRDHRHAGINATGRHGCRCNSARSIWNASASRRHSRCGSDRISSGWRRRKPAGWRAHLPAGHGRSRRKLRIFSGNTQIGEAVADASGQWRLMLPALKAGTYELAAASSTQRANR